MRLYYCPHCETYNLIGPPIRGGSGVHAVAYPSHPANGLACGACETLLEYTRAIHGTLAAYVDTEEKD